MNSALHRFSGLSRLLFFSTSQHFLRQVRCHTGPTPGANSEAETAGIKFVECGYALVKVDVPFHVAINHLLFVGDGIGRAVAGAQLAGGTEIIHADVFQPLQLGTQAGFVAQHGNILRVLYALAIEHAAIGGQSAMAVVVASPSFFHSKWCQLELNTFVWRSDAVNVINRLKGRDARKGLILLASGLKLAYQT